MRGGIQKKGNKYCAVVYDGVDPGTGRAPNRSLWTLSDKRSPNVTPVRYVLP